MLSHHEDCVEVGTEVGPSNGHYPARRGDGGLSTNGHRGQDELEERWTKNERVERWACVADCPVRRLDEQSGKRGASARVRGSEPSTPTTNVYGEFKGRVPGQFYGDSGGASRFFYCAKASRSEREAGLDELDEQLFAQSNRVKQVRNTHPTVKPIEVMRWLVRLVTPPGGTVLDPFLGSGTTGIAAALEGFDFIGIEREADYIAIASVRVRYWSDRAEAPEIPT